MGGNLFKMPAFGVLVNVGRRYGMGGSEIGFIILKVGAFTLYNSRNGWLVTFLLFSLKNVILSYSGRAQKFWASYQNGFWRHDKFNFIRTLSKKHCGRKDNLGRVFAKFNFSESRAGTVSSLISIGLLEKVVLVKERPSRFTLQGASGAGPSPSEAVFPSSCNSLAVYSTKVPVMQQLNILIFKVAVEKNEYVSTLHSATAPIFSIRSRRPDVFNSCIPRNATLFYLLLASLLEWQVSLLAFFIGHLVCVVHIVEETEQLIPVRNFWKPFTFQRIYFGIKLDSTRIIFDAMLKISPGICIPCLKPWKVKVVLPGGWRQSQVGHQVAKM